MRNGTLRDTGSRPDPSGAPIAMVSKSSVKIRGICGRYQRKKRPPGMIRVLRWTDFPHFAGDILANWYEVLRWTAESKPEGNGTHWEAKWPSQFRID